MSPVNWITPKICHISKSVPTASTFTFFFAFTKQTVFFFFTFLITKWVLCWIHAIYTRFTTFHYNSSRCLLFFIFKKLKSFLFFCMDRHARLAFQQNSTHWLTCAKKKSSAFQNNIWKTLFIERKKKRNIKDCWW